MNRTGTDGHIRHRSQRLACRILRELAREPLLVYELLNAGVAEYLSRLLPKLRETSIDRLLEVRVSVFAVYGISLKDLMYSSQRRVFCAFRPLHSTNSRNE